MNHLARAKYVPPTCDNPQCGESIDTSEPYMIAQPQKDGKRFHFCGSGCYDVWWRGLQ